MEAEEDGQEKPGEGRVFGVTCDGRKVRRKMAKYRKRPVVVEAEQWFPGVDIKGMVNAFKNPETGVVYSNEAEAEDGYEIVAAIRTLEGWHEVSPGDYVITGIKGERYPCKPDIFEATYEPCED